MRSAIVTTTTTPESTHVVSATIRACPWNFGRNKCSASVDTLMSAIDQTFGNRIARTSKSLERGLNLAYAIEYARLMFKRSVILLLLLVTPFAQAQGALECAMMDLQTAAPCCCAGDHEPSMMARGNGACCVVTVKAGERQFVAPAAEPSTRLMAKQLWNDAPVVAIAPTAPIIAVVAVAVSPSLPSEPLDPLSSPLYLRTARLRL
jgi:hypothetical protein